MKNIFVLDIIQNTKKCFVNVRHNFLIYILINLRFICYIV